MKLIFSKLLIIYTAILVGLLGIVIYVEGLNGWIGIWLLGSNIVANIVIIKFLRGST